MYFSKDTDSVPTFESPWTYPGWTPVQRILYHCATSEQSNQQAVFPGRNAYYPAGYSRNLLRGCEDCSGVSTVQNAGIVTVKV